MNIHVGKNCTGCGACAQVCAKNAINLICNEEGFLNPKVNQNLCIGCDLCERVCPIVNKPVMPSYSDKGYGCTVKDTKELSNSTSGAFFYTAAKYVLKNGGIVYGAKYDEKLHVVHERVDQLKYLDALRNSKYIQSNTKDTFKQVKCDVDNNKYVLYSGTPCQIAGLYNYLGGACDNLLLIEVFCGQITGYLSWDKYIEYLKTLHESEIDNMILRFKNKSEKKNSLGMFNGGWKDPFIKVVYKDGVEKLFSWQKDPWAAAYTHGLLTRLSCTECQFGLQMNKSGADISIGDFWGVENNAPAVYDSNGVNAVVVHSDKGESLLSEIADELKIQEVDLDMIYKGNPQACTFNTLVEERSDFQKDLRMSDESFAVLVSRYLGLEHNDSIDLSIGVFGGFNLRSAVLDLCSRTNCQMKWHISNTSIISAMSDKHSNFKIDTFPANELRASMLNLDLNKTISTVPEDFFGLDYLILDFIEERYDLFKINDTYLTISDALCDAGIKELALSNCVTRSNISVDMFAEQFDKFIEIVTEFIPLNRIIVVKNVLAPVYEDEKHKLVLFENTQLSDSIQNLNSLIEDYYSYVENNYHEIKIINVDSKLNYCAFKHKHGVIPSHANIKYCLDISKNILNYISN